MLTERNESDEYDDEFTTRRNLMNHKKSLTILQSLVVDCFVLSNKPQDRPESYHETNKSFNYQLLTTQLTQFNL